MQQNILQAAMGIISFLSMICFTWGCFYLRGFAQSLKELYDSRNSHAERIVKLETRIEDCPTCSHGRMK
jgi:hypothetical protein